jgi:pyruvate-formate lyase
VGLVNVADSLAAIKKLVFDEKKVTMKELKEALASNWEGNGYPDLRKAFLAAPKYGNDDDYADSITKELFDFFAETAVTLPNYQGAAQTFRYFDLGAMARRSCDRSDSGRKILRRMSCRRRYVCHAR